MNDAELFDLDRYDVYRGDRDFRSCNLNRGGGVLLAVARRYKSQAVSFRIVETALLDLPFFDIVGARIQAKDGLYYILVVYIRPGQSLNEYNSFFDILTSLQFLYNSKMLIIGDFNIPEYYDVSVGSTPATYLFRSFEDFLSFYSLRQCNMVLNPRGRILDLVCSTALPI